MAAYALFSHLLKGDLFMSSSAIRGSASPMLTLLLDVVTASGPNQENASPDFVIRTLERYWTSVLTHVIDDRFVADVQGISVTPEASGTYLSAMTQLIQKNPTLTEFQNQQLTTQHLGGRLMSLLERQVNTLFGSPITNWLYTGYNAWFEQFKPGVDTVVSPQLKTLSSAWFADASIERVHYRAEVSDICCYPVYSDICREYYSRLKAMDHRGGEEGVSVLCPAPRFSGISDDSGIVVSPLSDLLLRIVVYISQPDTLRQVLIHGLATLISRVARIRGRLNRSHKWVGTSKAYQHTGNDGLVSWLQSLSSDDVLYGRAHVTFKEAGVLGTAMEKWIEERLGSQRRVTIVRRLSLTRE